MILPRPWREVPAAVQMFGHLHLRANLPQTEMRVRGLWLLLMFIAVRWAGQARATPPPIFEADHALDSAWERATEEFKRCATRAADGNREGTVWVDVRFPADRAGYGGGRTPSGAPTFDLRISPRLVAADRACVRAVVARHVLPGMWNIAYASRGQTITKDVRLGTTARYLPTLAGLLPTWREVARATGDAAARSRLARSIRPLGTVGADGCLLVHREERLQPARKVWLADGAREAPQVWQPLVDKLAKPNRVREPYLFVVDGALLIAAVRFEREPSSPRRLHQPPDWSRALETYCLRPLDDRLRAEIDRGIDEIAACVSGAGTERLVAPRLEPPPDRRLHGLSVSSWRTCGIDQAGAIVCCGVRGDAPPAGTFSAVSADDQYGCAIRSNGELACWGKAQYGATPPVGHYTRLHVRGGGCAVTTEKSIRCWGVPVGWEAPPGEFVDVALGPFGIRAVATDGLIVRWGFNPDRRAAEAARVFASDCQTCVVTRAGSVDCEDIQGRQKYLGGPVIGFAPTCPAGCGLAPDGSIVCDPASRFPPPATLAMGRYAEIASTSDRICVATRNGKVACWGADWPGGALGLRPVTYGVLGR